MGDRKPVESPPLGPGAPERDTAEVYGTHEIEERFKDLADPLRDIPDDADVGAEGVFEDSHIGEVLESLDRDLIALAEVKARIGEIAALLMIDRLRRRIGL